MFGRLARAGTGILITVAIGACAAAAVTAAKDEPPAADAAVDVSLRPVTAPLPGGFVGLSIEVPSLIPYTGQNPHAVNPVFEQLIRNLAPRQQPVLRIGGDSTDVSWIPAPGLHRPTGVTYTISRRWLALAHALVQALGARVILGVDLEAGSRGLAVTEARRFMLAVGRRYVRALELGNEGNRYAILPWYRIGRRHGVYARGRGYNFSSFAGEFARTARRMPPVALAGPTVGNSVWESHLAGFLAGEPNVRLATFHRYPLNRCFTTPRSRSYPTIAHLLSPRASEGLAAGLGRWAALVHRRGIALRVDEFNSVACGGKHGVSDTFASALWVLETLFSMARAGVDGVNAHTFPGAVYQLFSFRRVDGWWRASVKPEYYGLMMFAQAAPPGSRLVAVQLRGAPNVHAWATVGRAGRLRVVLINDDTSSAHLASVRLVGNRHRAATLERLQAPSASATGGVTLGGKSFGSSTSTGVLTPRLTILDDSAGGYTLMLPPASAALLTVTNR